MGHVWLVDIQGSSNFVLWLFISLNRHVLFLLSAHRLCVYIVLPTNDVINKYKWSLAAKMFLSPHSSCKREHIKRKNELAERQNSSY